MGGEGIFSVGAIHVVRTQNAVFCAPCMPDVRTGSKAPPPHARIQINGG